MNATQRGGPSFHQLKKLYDLGSIGNLTDGQLLERFATDAQEVAELAFSALVERHAAMVWRVCLVILRDEHATEDAFQATFLVLVRKARSLWVQDSLGPWLHQVASRTASCLRRAIARRQKHERRRAIRDGASPASLAAPPDSELDGAIHEEVNRLPEKLRAPIVLCDIEGRTHQDAARCLGWPIGTVKTRQSHGRSLIRKRLVRRGLGLSAAGAIAEWLTRTASAAAPRQISQLTIIAAMLRSARSSAGFQVSAHVLALAQEALTAMFWIKVRSVTLAFVALVAVFSGATAFVLGSQDSNRKTDQPVANPPTAKTSRSPQPTTSKVTTAQPAKSDLRATLRAQQLATRKAKALYEIAKLTRELAEIALVEYEEVIYPGDFATVEAEVKVAESDLSRSKDRLDWAKRMLEKKLISPAQKTSEELNNKKAVFALEQAQSKKLVLVEYTKGKTFKELRSEVEKALSDELAKMAMLELETSKEKKLERELKPKSK
jgi:RNA polymerase sigma factor (sigma-70 family)